MTLQVRKTAAAGDVLQTGSCEERTGKKKGRPLSEEAGGLCQSAVSESAALCPQSFESVNTSRSVRP